MARLRTLREIIGAAWRKAGHSGEPPAGFVRGWREQNLDWGMWTLGTLFDSGSSLPRGSDELVEADDELPTAPRVVLEKQAARMRAGGIESERDRLAEIEAELKRRDG